MISCNYVSFSVSFEYTSLQLQHGRWRPAKFRTAPHFRHLSKLNFLLCHICYDTGPHLSRSHPKNSPRLVASFVKPGELRSSIRGILLRGPVLSYQWLFACCLRFFHPTRELFTHLETIVVKKNKNSSILVRHITTPVAIAELSHIISINGFTASHSIW